MADGHVFVSYSSADRAFAEDLVRQLEAGGSRVWFAPRNVRPGNDYSEQIQAAIEQAGAFVIIVSEASNESDFVRAETEMAFSRRRPIFPVRRGTTSPAPGLALFLQLRHWTDAFGPDRHNAVARLNGELVDLCRKDRQGRKRLSKYRPPGPSEAGPDRRRSGAVIALAVAGSGALLACILLLVTQADNEAARGATAATPVGNATAVDGGARPGERPDMSQLVDRWVRYINDTTPPPPPEENLIVDNAIPAAVNVTVAPATEGANAAGANTVGM